VAYPNSSLGQALQEALPSAKVVKTLEAPLMVNPSAIGPSTVFLSGDDAEAKTTATQLLADPGWADDAIVDLGGIASARGPEHYFLLFAALWQALGTATFNDGDDQEKLVAFARSGKRGSADSRLPVWYPERRVVFADRIVVRKALACAAGRGDHEQVGQVWLRPEDIRGVRHEPAVGRPRR
jgi:hypothetical protein